MHPGRLSPTKAGSEEFQTCCSSHSVHLWRCAVQAPWQNSPAERSGRVLSDDVVIGEWDISNAIAEACSACRRFSVLPGGNLRPKDPFFPTFLVDLPNTAS